MFNLLALLLFFVVFQNRAQISGIVQDENGQPVAAADVILRSATTTLRTTADERGRFQFDSVPPGDYLIDFKKTGFFQLSNFPTNAKSGLNDITVTLRRNR